MHGQSSAGVEASKGSEEHQERFLQVPSAAKGKLSECGTIVQQAGKLVTRNRQNADVLEAFFASGLIRLVLWSSTSLSFLEMGE